MMKFREVRKDRCHQHWKDSRQELREKLRRYGIGIWKNNF